MENVGIIATAILAFVAILGLVYSHIKELGEVRQKLSQLETKVKPFWQFVMKSVPDILMQGKSNPELLTRQDELLIRFRDGIILPHEKDELLRILETEREQATRERDTTLLILLGLLIVVLASRKLGTTTKRKRTENGRGNTGGNK